MSAYQEGEVSEWEIKADCPACGGEGTLVGRGLASKDEAVHAGIDRAADFVAPHAACSQCGACFTIEYHMDPLPEYKEK